MHGGEDRMRPGWCSAAMHVPFNAPTNANEPNPATRETRGAA